MWSTLCSSKNILLFCGTTLQWWCARVREKERERERKQRKTTTSSTTALISLFLSFLLSSILDQFINVQLKLLFHIWLIGILCAFLLETISCQPLNQSRSVCIGLVLLPCIQGRPSLGGQVFVLVLYTPQLLAAKKTCGWRGGRAEELKHLCNGFGGRDD